MTSADRRRAHARVGAATIGVFLLLLALGAGHQAAGASPGGPTAAPAPAPTVQPVQPTPPYGGHRGFEPGRDQDRGFPGGGDRGFGGGPPSEDAPAAPGGGGGTQT